MEWLFKVKERDDDELAKWLEFDFKIRDLKRRIKKLRNDLYPTRPVGIRETPKVDEQAPVVERGKNEKAAREAEMDDIRRKLIGGRKK